MIAIGHNWQALAFGVHFAWQWGDQCDCGRGHWRLAIYFGPFLFEVSK